MQTRLKHYLAICAIFRDEAPYLKEWIEFHRLVGVDHFFLYNNFSQDEYRSILLPYIEQGIVTLEDWSLPKSEGGQSRAFEHCLEHHKDKARWIAFLDMDEFLFAPEADQVVDILKDYERYPGIVVNWQIYGSSGHEKTPRGLVIENFTRRAESTWIRNRRVKSIVNPAKAVRPKGPHFFEYLDGELAVTENGEPMQIFSPTKLTDVTRRLKRFVTRFIPQIPVDPYVVHQTSIRRVSVNKLRINHYAVKSKEEYTGKLKRHDAPTEKAEGLLKLYKLERFVYHDRNEVEDTILHRYLPRLKQLLESMSLT